MFPLLGPNTAHVSAELHKNSQNRLKNMTLELFLPFYSLFLYFVCLFVFFDEIFPKYFSECLVFCYYVTILEVRETLVMRITFWVNLLPRAHYYP